METSLKGRAYDHIFCRLMGGDLPPGSKLSDVKLAKEIGMSRTPVREAIIQMESQGIVEHVEGVGPRVRTLDRQEIDETFELREMLEVGAIGKAATRLSDAELSELEAICEQLLALARLLQGPPDPANAGGVFDRLVVLDMAFHLAIMRGARNRQLLQILGNVQVLSRALRRRAELADVSPLKRAAFVWRDHRRIVRALRRRDPAAAQHWMSRHVQHAREYHLAAYDWHQRQVAIGRAGSGDFSDQLQRMLSGMELGGTPNTKQQPSAPVGDRRRPRPAARRKRRGDGVP